MADASDIPADLLQLQIASDQLREELRAIPVRPWTDTSGTEHRTDTGWRPEHDDQEQQLRARLLDIVQDVDAHPYWVSVPGTVVDERGRLKQAARAARDAGNREDAGTGQA